MQTVTEKEVRWERGDEIYRRLLPELMAEPENIGKIVAIDPDSGDYAIGDDLIPAVESLRARHPGVMSVSKRIGYNAVYAVGGSVHRVNEKGERIGN